MTPPRTIRERLIVILIAAAIAGACVAAFALGDAASAATPPTPTQRLQAQVNRLVRVVAAQQRQVDMLTYRLQAEEQTLSVRVENTELFDVWIEPLRGCVSGAYPALFGASLIFDPNCLWGSLRGVSSAPRRVQPRSFAGVSR